MYRRLLLPRITEALLDTRVVTIAGPRQSGKTTLARSIADPDRPFLSLDETSTYNAARSDPVALIRDLRYAVIDEVQRAPELLLALKASVDADPRPGRFLLTGSANLMSLPQIADSLAGRMQVLRLLPLAQAELERVEPDFLDRVFAGRAPRAGRAGLGPELIERVFGGGYPEALQRANWSRRRRWHLDYIDALIQRDVRDIAQVSRLGQLARLLRVLAEHSGQLINYSALGAALGMNHVSCQKYIGVFKQLYLIQSLDPWYSNRISRLIKTPKLHFLDSGLLAAVRNLSPERIQAERTLFGPLLETFVLAEVIKLISSRDDNYELFHYRDKERNEVDIVIEDDQARVVGIEVKAAATVTAADFNGLRKLALAAGENFAAGVVLYDHDQTLSFGERLWAVPVSSLWAGKPQTDRASTQVPAKLMRQRDSKD